MSPYKKIKADVNGLKTEGNFCTVVIKSDLWQKKFSLIIDFKSTFEIRGLVYQQFALVFWKENAWSNIINNTLTILPPSFYWCPYKPFHTFINSEGYETHMTCWWPRAVFLSRTDDLVTVNENRPDYSIPCCAILFVE